MSTHCTLIPNTGGHIHDSGAFTPEDTSLHTGLKIRLSSSCELLLTKDISSHLLGI